MYSERKNIPSAVSEAFRVGYKIAPKLEIVIVDDASTDRCGEMADQLALDHPEIKVVHHPANCKLGGSLKTSFAATTKERVLYMDNDLPIKMYAALNAIPLTDEADLVIGWRKTRAESWRRAVISRIYNWMIRRFLHFPFNIELQAEASYFEPAIR
jgi:glycosyltransferase involved in cell wall biosynthesis